MSGSASLLSKIVPAAFVLLINITGGCVEDQGVGELSSLYFVKPQAVLCLVGQRQLLCLRTGRSSLASSFPFRPVRAAQN